MTKQPRPRCLTGSTYEINSACGPIYITCNDKDGELFEVFARLGKAGGCGSLTSEGFGMLISIGLRSGTKPADLVKSMRGMNCHKSSEGVPSCLDAIAQAIKEHCDDLPC